MANDLPWTAQELDSLAHFSGGEEPFTEAIEGAGRSNHATASSSERASRYLSAMVLLLLVAAAGGLCWRDRQAIVSSAAEFKKHSSSGLDIVMWASGSKQSFKEALTARLSQPSFDANEMKPAYNTEVSNVDLQNLSSAWNGKHK